MENNELKIIIIGAVCLGKTTIAKEIENALRRAGIECVNLDIDNDPHKKVMSARESELHQRKIEGLKAKGTKVAISTKYVNKTGFALIVD